MAVATELLPYLEKAGLGYKDHYCLDKKSFIKAGGICDLFIEPDAKDQLIELVSVLRAHNLALKVVGNLSNVLFRDGRIITPIISTSRMKGFKLDGNGELYAEAGASLSRVAREVTGQGYIGFSGLAGFPATIGGAVFMNASCYGDAISDYLLYVECVDREGGLVTLTKDELSFAWRYSAFHQELSGYVILAARFRLNIGSANELTQNLKLTKESRVEYQEHRFPNLGSTFATRDIYGEIYKTHPLYRPGFLLIKGYVRWFGKLRHKLWARLINRYTQYFFQIQGDEKVGFSEHTLNCIVNKGGASATEIIRFVKNVQSKISVGVPLEIEIIEEIE